jgi:hypothetical protein
MKRQGGSIMKVKPLNLVLLSFLLVTIVAFQNSCNLSSPSYTLTVIIEEGVTGTPESGTYEYKEFSEVEYDYDMTDGAVQPEIYFNNLRNVVLKGTLVMYCDTVMTVRQIDIRSKWTLILLEAGEEISDWTIEFTGADLRSGTFTDDRGYSGTWQVTDSNDWTFTYSDWEDYVFTGSLSGLSGDWEGENKSGTWYLNPSE